MPLQPPPAERIPSVTELTRDIKQLLEVNLGSLWVKGEVSNFKRQTSGHCYFSLKDSTAQISAVFFRGYAARSTMELKDGMEVIAYGEISIYEPRGQYQLIIQEILLEGMGRLQAALERLKRKLEAEGLFRPENKQALPQLPRRIAFVTSPTGAALQDFLSILRRRRWRGELLIIPTRVQGSEATAEIAAAIQQANTIADIELLVVGRGGGSLEDLWPFNEEAVVRAIHASRIPIISAVGHEIDITLSDFAADTRAETPSAAAELITSHYLAVTERLSRAAKALNEAADIRLERMHNQLKLHQATLRQVAPLKIVQHYALRLDDQGSRLQSLLQQRISQIREHLNTLAHRMASKHPGQRYALAYERTRQLHKRLVSISPEQTLKRGYTMVITRNRKAIDSRKKIKPGQQLRILFHDGEADITVDPHTPLQDV